MAITRIGSLTESADAERTTNTGSESISVPADAEILIVGVHGFHNTANYFTGGAMTLGGTTFTTEVAQGNADNTEFMGAIFAIDCRALTGTRTLAWDWSGTADPLTGVRIVWGCYKGVNTSAMVRDSDGAQTSSPAFTTPTLTASAGDLIVAWAWGYYTAAGAPTWSNATQVTGYLTQHLYEAKASWAEGSPTGNTTVGVSAWTGVTDGGICAIVLAPAATGGTSRPVFLNLQRQFRN
jgi:hypothetical protein